MKNIEANEEAVSVEQLLKESREYLLGERLKQEMLVEQWANKLKRANPLILKDVDLPEEISLKALIPELYKETPNVEVYKEQFQAFKALANQINEIARNYNEEAKKLLEEYRELTSSK